MTVRHKQVAVIGAGPAGLMAAEVLAEGGASVTVYDAMPSVARKFLMAGRGGLNLTHGEELATFLSRYREAQSFLDPAIRSFPPQRLRDWCEALGEKTFVGSSGRVFPESFKASPLLRAWLRRLDSQGVKLAMRHRWTGWDGQRRLLFDTPEGERAIAADAVALALGGASWPRLGSDGAWTNALASKGVAITKFKPANCGFTVAWSTIFRDRFEGQPLKSIALSFGDRTVRGEAIVTRDGIEGGAIYALSAELREAIVASGEATLQIALRPDLSTNDLLSRLSAPRGKQSLSNVLRKMLQLPSVAIGLLQEAAINASGQLASFSPEELAALVDAVPLKLIGTSGLARAISTAGGIAWDELDNDYMIKRLPGIFAAGEMLDWEAPTGGYLLQASFATGVAAGKGVLKWLNL
jgi:uncharacterized flavoprotein (TIGR03862 family)